MTLLQVLPAFLVAVLAIASVPGPAVALIVRRSAVHGGRATIPLVLGVEAGLFFWAIAAALGLATLVTVSAVAYELLRVVGSAFLVVLGVLALRAAWRTRRLGAKAVPHDLPSGRQTDALADLRGHRSTLSPYRAFSEGFLTNLANPKAAVFMVAFFPQFIPLGYPVLPTTIALASVQVLVETLLYGALALGVGQAGKALAQPRVRSAIDATSGGILIALGLRIALTPRPA